MQISKDTLAGRTIVAVVYVAVVALLAAGIFLGVWTAREMNAVVTDQFNAQQMVIAQTAKARVEREIGEIKRELYLQAQAVRGMDEDTRELAESLHESLVRLSESGVRRVEVVDRAARRIFTGGSARQLVRAHAWRTPTSTTRCASPRRKSPPSGCPRCAPTPPTKKSSSPPA